MERVYNHSRPEKEIEALVKTRKTRLGARECFPKVSPKTIPEQKEETENLFGTTKRKHRRGQREKRSVLKSGDKSKRPLLCGKRRYPYKNAPLKKGIGTSFQELARKVPD